MFSSIAAAAAWAWDVSFKACFTVFVLFKLLHVFPFVWVFLFTTFDCSCIHPWLIRIVTGSERGADVIVQHFSTPLRSLSCESVSMYPPLRSIVYILWFRKTHTDKRTNERIVLSERHSACNRVQHRKMMNNCLCALSLENLVYI